jgi:hypothetical protein
MSRLTVCSFWWHDHAVAGQERYDYRPRHIEIHRNMFARHLTVPHDYVCITDRPDLVDKSIRTVPLDRRTFVPGTRYAKLMVFRRDIAALLGPRILSSDLDVVLVRNCDGLVQRSEPLVLYRNVNFGLIRGRMRFNSSMIMLTAGVRPDLYDDFDPRITPGLMRQLGHSMGTDQKWISSRVDRDNPYWDHTHGVWNAMRMSDKGPGVATELPDNAKIVLFMGKREPGMAKVQAKFPWVKEHWR